MNDDIKPCPFCGAKGKGELIEMRDTHYEGYNFVVVYCLFCGAIGPFGIDPKNAEEKWNRREN
jgi:Lar family restriction alleviation protein